MGGGGHDSHGHGGAAAAEPIIPVGGAVDAILVYIVCAMVAGIGLFTWGFGLTQPIAQVSHEEHAAGAEGPGHGGSGHEATGHEGGAAEHAAPAGSTTNGDSGDVMEGPPAGGAHGGSDEMKGPPAGGGDVMEGPPQHGK